MATTTLPLSISATVVTPQLQRLVIEDPRQRRGDAGEAKPQQVALADLGELLYGCRPDRKDQHKGADEQRTNRQYQFAGQRESGVQSRIL